MSLCAALFGAEVPRCIALVGAGGKTSSILQMAEELRQAGKRVAITTTTKMHPPENRELLCGDPETAGKLLDGGEIAWVGQYYNKYKMEGVAGVLPGLLQMADHVMIEADGAKTRPIKMIDDTREPVIPAECDAVVAVCGMRAIGQPAAEVLFRRERTEFVPEHVITAADAATLLQRCYGPRYVILNQCDDEEKIAAAREITARLPGCRCVLTRWAKPIE